MKQFRYILFIILLASNLSTSGQSQSTDSEKVLIVYLSRTNNTKAVASMIQEAVGGRLVELELEKSYPTDYQAIVKQVQRENEEGFLPPLKTNISDLEGYDYVFVGFPTWGMRMPPPMKSFLSTHDLSGKTVIPFNTNAGYGVGSGFDTVSELCLDSEVFSGFSVKGGIERDGVLFVMEGQKAKRVQAQLVDWLKEMNLLKEK